VTLGIHRNVSLLAVVFVLVHIVTTLLDGYVPIGVIAAVVPFTSAYRPVWVGLGAVALDLLLAVVLTSLLRRKVGYRAWRLVHWTAYASWPVALVHSLGTGSDRSSAWMIALIAVLTATVVVALLVRLRGHKAPGPASPPRRREAFPPPRSRSAAARSQEKPPRAISAFSRSD
jgi:predicted ferric reductase